MLKSQILKSKGIFLLDVDADEDVIKNVEFVVGEFVDVMSGH
jgi:hypothetical protein